MKAEEALERLTRLPIFVKSGRNSVRHAVTGAEYSTPGLFSGAGLTVEWAFPTSGSVKENIPKEKLYGLVSYFEAQCRLDPLPLSSAPSIS